LGKNFSNQTNEVKTQVIRDAGMSDYLPSDFSNWKGDLKIRGNLINSGLIDQYGDISAQNIRNTSGSVWNSSGNLTTSLDFINENFFDSIGNIQVGQDLLNSGQLGLTGNLSARDIFNTTNNGVITVAGDLAARRNLQNDKQITVSGALAVNNNLINSTIQNIYYIIFNICSIYMCNIVALQPNKDQILNLDVRNKAKNNQNTYF
jgi:hypothetical protein